MRLGEWWDEPLLPDIGAHEREPIKTGLLDAEGRPILRAHPPIGFGRDHEHRRYIVRSDG